MTRHSLLTACGVILGVFVAATTLSAGSVSNNSLAYLTFNAPVSLPGVSLGAGTYAFETVGDSRHVVRVRNRATNLVVFMGFTIHVDRPADGRIDQPVVFGEAPRGQPTPILTWYPPDVSYGQQFIYRTKSR